MGRVFALVHHLKGARQRFALPALGRGRRSRPARKMIRRVKLLEICARRPQGRQSPASGARCVGWRFHGELFVAQRKPTVL
jgi:hypothetical protein